MTDLPITVTIPGAVLETAVKNAALSAIGDGFRDDSLRTAIRNATAAELQRALASSAVRALIESTVRAAIERALPAITAQETGRAVARGVRAELQRALPGVAANNGGGSREEE